MLWYPLNNNEYLKNVKFLRVAAACMVGKDIFGHFGSKNFEILLYAIILSNSIKIVVVG